tara:strand:+ start:979 stop:1146 length:168 start_codon:yes stop_codon:yes gene_type:complete
MARKKFKMKNKGNFDFGKTMDLNVDRYGPSATQSNIDFKKKRDFSNKKKINSNVR